MTSLFSKKHYEFVAGIANAQEEDSLDEFMEALADAFKKDNSQFDKEKFLEAAGVGDMEEGDEESEDEEESEENKK